MHWLVKDIASVRLLRSRPVWAAVLATGYGCPRLALGQAVLDPASPWSLGASAGVTADSNIVAARGGASDVEANSSAMVGYARQAAYSLKANMTWSAGAFSRNPSQDYVDPSFDVGLESFTGDRSMAVGVQAARSHTADGILGTRVDEWSDGLNVGSSGPFFGIYSLSLSAAFETQRYQNADLHAIQTWQVGAGLSRELYPGCDLVFDASLSGDRIAHAGTSLGETYTAGLDKQLLPKVKGSVHFGWEERVASQATGGYSGLATDVDLTWQASSTVGVTLGAKRTTSAIASGQNIASESITLGGSVALAGRWSLGATAGYARTDYLAEAARHDGGLSVGASLRWQVTQGVSALVTADQTINDSNQSLSARYARTIFTLSLSYKR